MPQEPNLDAVQRGIMAIPQVAALGIRATGFDPDGVTLELPYDARLVGYPATGVMAGGAIYTLMDTVAGMSVMAALGALMPIATLDLRIDYLKPASPGASVFGRSQCYKLTRTIAFVRGRAFQDDPDRPIAHTTGTFIITRRDGGAGG